MLGAIHLPSAPPTTVSAPQRFMVRLSSRIVSRLRASPSTICFRTIWILLTYVAWRVVLPRVLVVRHRLSKNQVTEIHKLLYEHIDWWELKFIWFCIILLVGCILSFIPRQGTRSTWLGVVTIWLFSHFVFDSIICWSFYNILEIHGFAQVFRLCLRPRRKSIDSDLCRLLASRPKDTVIAALVMWKLFGLILFAFILWYQLSISENKSLRAKIEQEVQESAKPIKVAEEAKTAEDEV